MPFLEETYKFVHIIYNVPMVSFIWTNRIFNWNYVESGVKHHKPNLKQIPNLHTLFLFFLDMKPETHIVIIFLFFCLT
jgi:hypothetical protein